MPVGTGVRERQLRVQVEAVARDASKVTANGIELHIDKYLVPASVSERKEHIRTNFALFSRENDPPLPEADVVQRLRRGTTLSKGGI